jgi:cyclophilin family peptidyl-prolyl cis-trans isomerase/HEAT repeat protein
LGLVAIAMLAASAAGAQQSDPIAVRQAMFVAEDHRATSDAALAPLLRGLESRDAATAAAAYRAIGRLERPALANRLLPGLGDSRSAVRYEAAYALGQIGQGIDSSDAAAGPVLDAITAAMLSRLDREEETAVLGALARSVGRLPFRTAEPVARTRTALVRLTGRSTDTGLVLAAARGLEALLRISGRLLPPAPEVGARLAELIGTQGGPPDLAVRIRRIAWTALPRAGGATPALAVQGMADADEQVRRLTLIAVAAAERLEGRRELLLGAFQDRSPMVRLEALRAWGRRQQADDCGPIVAAVRDGTDRVALEAIDLLGNPCPADFDIAQVLGPLVDTLAGAQRPAFFGLAQWHRGAHALVALSKVAPERVRGLLSRAAADVTWQVRMYAAAAAANVGAPALLIELINDRDDNVREAAVRGLFRVRGHGADHLYIQQLARTDYQLLITTANTLAGSPARDSSAAALFAALARVTRDGRETSRDARMALLDRLEELADPADAPRLSRYLSDFDPAIAARAAGVVERWTGSRPRVSPEPLPKTELSLAEILQYRGRRLRVTMSPTAGGGVFEIELYPDLAPATVARVVELASRAYYDDLTFHRVVPNFVIQGGSPGANEYTGDGPFMRDELGAVSHERGTVGISTRGRDTGDAQIFVNLVDNPRLDFQYTVWGSVASGLDVVDAILEGDTMARVEIVDRAR